MLRKMASRIPTLGSMPTSGLPCSKSIIKQFDRDLRQRENHQFCRYELTDCVMIASQDNQRLILCSGNASDYIRSGDVVDVTCNDGYWFGSNFPKALQFRCTDSKTYTPPINGLTDCVPITCPSPPEVLRIRCFI